MEKLSKRGRYEIYLDVEYGYIAIKGLGVTYWLDFDDWHDFINAVNDGNKNIGGANNADSNNRY